MGMQHMVAIMLEKMVSGWFNHVEIIYAVVLRGVYPSSNMCYEVFPPDSGLAVFLDGVGQGTIKVDKGDNLAVPLGHSFGSNLTTTIS